MPYEEHELHAVKFSVPDIMAGGWVGGKIQKAVRGCKSHTN